MSKKEIKNLKAEIARREILQKEQAIISPTSRGTPKYKKMNKYKKIKEDAMKEIRQKEEEDEIRESYEIFKKKITKLLDQKILVVTKNRRRWINTRDNCYKMYSNGFVSHISNEYAQSEKVENVLQKLEIIEKILQELKKDILDLK